MLRALALASIWVSAVLSLAGCALSAEVLLVPTEGAGGLLVVELPPGGAPVVTAIALDRAPARLVSWPAPESGAVYALTYPCALTALELGEGPLPLASEGLPSRPVPRPDKLARATIEGGAVGAGFAPVDGFPAELAALRLESRDTSDGCVRVESVEQVIPGSVTDRPVLVVPIDASRVLVGTGRGQFFVASREGIVRETRLSTTTPRLAGFLAEDGELWLAGAGGEVVRGDLERGFVAAPSLSSTITPEFMVMDGARGGAAFELFLVSSEPSLHHFDGTRWTRADSSEAPSPRDEISVLWAGPGEAFATGVETPSITRFYQGLLEHEPPPAGPRDPPASIAVHPSLGFLVGTFGRVPRCYATLADTECGAVFQREGSGWRELARAPLTLEAEHVTPLGEGFMFGSGRGLMTHYTGERACEPTAVATGRIRGFRKHGDGFTLIAAHSGDDDSVGFVRFVQDHPPEACPLAE